MWNPLMAAIVKLFLNRNVPESKKNQQVYHWAMSITLPQFYRHMFAAAIFNCSRMLGYSGLIVKRCTHHHV